MPILLRKDGSKLYVPDDSDWQSKVDSGEFSVEEGQDVSYVDRYGKQSTVDPGVFLRERERGEEGSLESTEVVTERVRKDRIERENDTIGGEAKAFLGGAADFLTFGAIDGWKDEREVNPWASGIGSAAGLGLTLLIPGAGEANAARAVGTAGRALRGAEAMAAGATDVSRLSRLGRGLGEAASYTPMGVLTRAGSAAGRLVGGAVREGSALGRAAQTAAEGAVLGGGEALGRGLLDDDHKLTAEGVLSGMALGGFIGGAGSLASTGIGKAYGRLSEGVGGRAGRAFRDEAQFTSAHDAIRPRAVDFAGRVDDDVLTGLEQRFASSAAHEQTAKQVWKLQGTLSDIAIGGKPGTAAARNALERAGMDVDDLTMNAELIRDGVRRMQLPASHDMHITPGEFLGVYNSHLHELDRAAFILGGKEAGGLAIPKHFSRDMVSARTRAVSKIDPKLDPVEAMARELDARLTTGTKFAPGEAAKGILGQAIDAVVARSPLGKAADAVKGGGITTGVVLSQVLDGGITAMLGKAVPVAIGAGAGLAAVRHAFRDPHVGGLIAASATRVLDGAGLTEGDGSRKSPDQRQALRSFSDRVRRVTPEAAASAAARQAQAQSVSDPRVVAAVADRAAARHRELLSLVDRLDPMPRLGGEAVLGRPLPSGANASRMADFIRASSSPEAFVVSALSGRLTPEMLATAERVWPATVARMRERLLGELAGVDPSTLPASTRRVISTLLGPSAGASRFDRTAYRSAMDSLVQRTHGQGQPSRAKAPAQPPGPVAQNPMATPAQRAVNPAGGRG